jgi:hypothetical protein
MGFIKADKPRIGKNDFSENGIAFADKGLSKADPGPIPGKLVDRNMATGPGAEYRAQRCQFSGDGAV